MPRGDWGRRKEPITDAWIWESVNRAGGLGKHDANGHYAKLTMRCDTADEASEYRRSLFRCAHYLSRTGQAPVSVFMTPVRRGAGGKFLFEFTVADKSYARSHHLAKHGSDRAKWPYDPIMRRKPE